MHSFQHRGLTVGDGQLHNTDDRGLRRHPWGQAVVVPAAAGHVWCFQRVSDNKETSAGRPSKHVCF